MFFENRQGDNGPITRLGSIPVYLTTFLVAGILAGIVFIAFTGMAGAFLLAFAPARAWTEWEIWRVLSYILVERANFFTLFMLMFLYSFGQNCEEALGRQRYLGFLGVLILVPVIVATIMWGMGIAGGLAGSIHISIGFVIGFATIYPNTEWWNWVPMKFVAFGCLFLAAVGHVSENDYIGLMATLVTAGVSYYYIHAMKSGAWDGFSGKALFRRKPKLRVLPTPRERSARYEKEPDDATEEMDMLLDKIAKSGIDSLTSKERARLEKARQELMKRESPGR
jgi:membrane associated rhomboid family serine protease